MTCTPTYTLAERPYSCAELIPKRFCGIDDIASAIFGQKHYIPNEEHDAAQGFIANLPIYCRLGSLNRICFYLVTSPHGEHLPLGDALSNWFGKDCHDIINGVKDFYTPNKDYTLVFWVRDSATKTLILIRYQEDIEQTDILFFHDKQ